MADPDFDEWAETLAEVADYLKTALDAGGGVLESKWLDPLMILHGEILAAAETASPNRTEGNG